MLSDKEKRVWDTIDELAVTAGGYLAKPKRPLHRTAHDMNSL